MVKRISKTIPLKGYLLPEVNKGLEELRSVHTFSIPLPSITMIINITRIELWPLWALSLFWEKSEFHGLSKCCSIFAVNIKVIFSIEGYFLSKFLPLVTKALKVFRKGFKVISARYFKSPFLLIVRNWKIALSEWILVGEWETIWVKEVQVA